MKRLSGSILFLLLLVGSFFFQTPTSFAASTHTNLQAAPLGIGGGNLDRVVWTSSDTLGFVVSNIVTGSGEFVVYNGETEVGATFLSPDSNGKAYGEVYVNGCNNLGV